MTEMLAHALQYPPQILRFCLPPLPPFLPSKFFARNRRLSELVPRKKNVWLGRTSRFSFRYTQSTDGRRVWQLPVESLLEPVVLSERGVTVARLAVYVPLEARKGKEEEAADLLRSAVPYVN